MSRRLTLLFHGIVLVLAASVLGCQSDDRPTVVVYTALDELYSRPILDAFEKETGIRVLAQYDTEAAKTTGLVNRLIAERDRPRADVFWNNEVVQMIVLKDEKVLQPYASTAALPIPPRFKDKNHYWTGFAARGRVIIYNTELVDEPPRSILDFRSEEWRGKAAIANPLFGTTAAHAAVLFAVWGESEARGYFDALRKNDIAILPGNATVRDLVARGEYAVGLTDTDDANGAVEDGFPVKWHLADNDEGGLGVLIIPNTVALIAGAPHEEAGRALIDYLLSPEVERRLSQTRAIQIPLNPSVEGPSQLPALDEINLMQVNFAEAAAAMSTAAAYIRDEFLP